MPAPGLRRAPSQPAARPPHPRRVNIEVQDSVAVDLIPETVDEPGRPLHDPVFMSGPEDRPNAATQGVAMRREYRCHLKNCRIACRVVRRATSPCVIVAHKEDKAVAF